MATKVELLIFPDIDNPTWELEPAQEATFNKWYAAASMAKAFDKPAEGGATLFPASALPTLGYAGFQLTGAHGEPVQVYKNQLVGGFGLPIGPAESIDQFLFHTQEKALFDRYGLDATILADQAARTITDLGGSCPLEGADWGSIDWEGDNSRWNGSRNRGRTKCYDYANNIFDEAPIMLRNPGGGTWSVADIKEALDLDRIHHLDRMPSDAPGGSNGQYIAACIHTLGRSGGYHFLRLDRRGTWSHKNGSRAATSHGANGVIRNLCTATFSIPLLFVGFFKTDERARDRIRGRSALGGTPTGPAHFKGPWFDV